MSKSWQLHRNVCPVFTNKKKIHQMVLPQFYISKTLQLHRNVCPVFKIKDDPPNGIATSCIPKRRTASIRVVHGSTVDMKCDLHEDDELQRENRID